MPDLVDSAGWDGVYAIAVGDGVGPSPGVSNDPHQNLANRTAYLRDEVNSLVSVGSILTVPFGATPDGYLPCAGAVVSRTTYSALFAAIGTNYGGGDGSTTFNLPDFRGLFLRGYADGSGNNPDTQPQVAGLAAPSLMEFSSFTTGDTSGDVDDVLQVECDRLNDFGLNGVYEGYLYLVIEETSTGNLVAVRQIDLTQYGTPDPNIVRYIGPDLGSYDDSSHRMTVRGDILGAVQEDDFESHIHSMPNVVVYDLVNEQPGIFVVTGSSWSGDSTAMDTLAGGGNETRPLNVGVNFFIRYEEI